MGVFTLLGGDKLESREIPELSADVDSVAIYVVRHDWHVGIAVPVSKIDKRYLPERKDFPVAKFLEIGWGDARFYRAKEVTVSMALNALFRPTESIVHIAGFDRPVEKFFPNSGVYKIELSRPKFDEVSRFIHRSIERENLDIARNSGTGRYGKSFFYKGIGSYHLFRTCNTWAAQALHIGGIEISVSGTITAEGLATQIAEQAVILQERTTPESE
ncbi:MAG: hypothetical protein CMM52_09450 [Rhodospirillaceae bacterium]|nr:hypothetical protein [Rhodospirillaceae bacterium]|tara:strand:+ start:20266 stop:20913 length:648 start_codon:yes stop_codon:yes gene_type:complete